MPVLSSSVDPASEVYRQNRLAMEEALADVNAQLDIARGGGGERYVERHRSRGKFLARERIELLLDPDTPFLELAPLVGSCRLIAQQQLANNFQPHLKTDEAAHGPS